MSELFSFEARRILIGLAVRDRRVPGYIVSERAVLGLDFRLSVKERHSISYALARYFRFVPSGPWYRGGQWLYITDDRLAEWDRVLSAGGIVEDTFESDPATARMVRGIFI